MTTADMLDIFAHGFMQRAILSGVSIAVLCAVMGMFLVLRRYSLFGDAAAHTSFGGIALGLFTGIYPIWAAYAVTLGCSLVLSKVRSKLKVSGDATIAMMLSGGIAAGVLLIDMAGGFTMDIFSFIFGNILLVSTDETVLTACLAAGVLLSVLALYGKLVHSTFDQRHAEACGIRVEWLNVFVMVAAGITVVTAIQLVGILLISALFVIPNVSAIMYGFGFRKTLFLSIGFAVLAVMAGIMLSYVLDVTPSGITVLVAITIFGVSAALKGVRSRTPSRQTGACPARP